MFCSVNVQECSVSIDTAKGLKTVVSVPLLSLCMCVDISVNHVINTPTLFLHTVSNQKLHVGKVRK